MPELQRGQCRRSQTSDRRTKARAIEESVLSPLSNGLAVNERHPQAATGCAFKRPDPKGIQPRPRSM
jgi:hypothetical protein